MTEYLLHPWTLDAFEKHRPDQFRYTRDVIYNEDCTAKFKVVHAPVKSGKRSFPEIASLLNPGCVHIFLSALNRKADKEQHKELEKYGISVYKVYNRNSAESCIQFVMTEKREVHVHLDELDYGCKHDQVMASVFLILRKEDHVKIILYSATIDIVKSEFLHKSVSGFSVLPPFVPSPNMYCGIEEYIKSGKLIQSSPFLKFDSSMVLTEQGQECLARLVDDSYNEEKKQHMGILRLSGKQDRVNDFRSLKNHVQVLHQFVETYQIQQEKPRLKKLRILFVGSGNETIKWDDESFWSTKFAPDIPVLIVICQVAGRSTEWKCHPYLSWFHTCRSDTTTVGTQIQDQERVVYYKTEYNKNTDITLYGNVSCGLYSAGQITYDHLIRTTKKKLALTLSGKSSQVSSVVTKIYDDWEDIPEEHKLKLKLKKEDFIADKFVLRKQMNYTRVKDGKTLHYIVDVPDWDRVSVDEGLYLTDIRGSMENFLVWCYQEGGGKSSKHRRPVWHLTELLKHASCGINKTNPVKINVFYEDGEKNPEKYKFIVRELEFTAEVSFKNDSMYNNLS